MQCSRALDSPLMKPFPPPAVSSAESIDVFTVIVHFPSYAALVINSTIILGCPSTPYEPKVNTFVRPETIYKGCRTVKFCPNLSRNALGLYSLDKYQCAHGKHFPEYEDALDNRSKDSTHRTPHSAFAMTASVLPPRAHGLDTTSIRSWVTRNLFPQSRPTGRCFVFAQTSTLWLSAPRWLEHFFPRHKSSIRRFN